MQELEGVLEARAGDFDVESYAKVVWMMGRAHHRSPTACALVDTLADRALSEQATPQVSPNWQDPEASMYMDIEPVGLQHLHASETLPSRLIFNSGPVC